MQSPSHATSHLILTTTQGGGWYYYPHFKALKQKVGEVNTLLKVTKWVSGKAGIWEEGIWHQWMLSHQVYKLSEEKEGHWEDSEQIFPGGRCLLRRMEIPHLSHVGKTAAVPTRLAGLAKRAENSCLEWGSANSKGLIANFLGFSGHKIFVIPVQPCHCSCRQCANEWVYVPVKFMYKKQGVGWTWLLAVDCGPLVGGPLGTGRV